MQRLFMVGGWTDIYAHAKACGFHLTVAQNKEDVKPEDLAVVDRMITIAKNDPRVPELAAALHQSEPFDAAVSFQEHGVFNAARVREELGIFGNPLSAVGLARDKGLLRQHMKARGIPSIPFALVDSADEARAFADEIGWPVMIKPVSASGSDCVQKLTGPQDVQAAYARIASRYPGQGVIVEQFMVGPEVSVEALSWNGRHTVLGVTDKITTGAPFFVELGHSHPSSLGAAVIAQIEALTLQLLDSMGHLHGPTHTEMIVTADGPRVVEAHTRTGGDRIFEMVELVHGVNLFDTTLRGFAGAFPDLAPHAPRGAAIRYFDLPEGVVTHVAGIDEARAMPGIVRIEHSLETGKPSMPVRKSGDRLGYVLAQGADRAEAVRRVEDAMARIRVVVESSTALADGRTP